MRRRRGRAGSSRPIPVTARRRRSRRPSSSISSSAPPSVRRRLIRHDGGRGVPADVRERLARELHDVGRAARELGGHLIVDVDDRERRSVRSSNSRRELLQGLVELPVGEDPRPQPEDVVAQVADRAVDVLDRALDAPARSRRRAPSPRSPAGPCRPRTATGSRRRAAPSRSARAPRAAPAARAPPGRAASPRYRRAFSIATPAWVASTTSAASSSSENSGAPLLGQVDVAEHPAEGQHRRAQERVHRRVVRREPGRSRIGSDVRDAHRTALLDQQAEDAVADGDATRCAARVASSIPCVMKCSMRGTCSSRTPSAP